MSTHTHRDDDSNIMSGFVFGFTSAKLIEKAKTILDVKWSMDTWGRFAAVVKQYYTQRKCTSNSDCIWIIYVGVCYAVNKHRTLLLLMLLRCLCLCPRNGTVNAEWRSPAFVGQHAGRISRICANTRGASAPAHTTNKELAPRSRATRCKIFVLNRFHIDSTTTTTTTTKKHSFRRTQKVP